jgi:Amt family ammonium transporter
MQVVLLKLINCIVAYAMVLGKRRDYNENVNTPHNVSFVFLGLALMWFGKYIYI